MSRLRSKPDSLTHGIYVRADPDSYNCFSTVPTGLCLDPLPVHAKALKALMPRAGHDAMNQ